MAKFVSYSDEVKARLRAGYEKNVFAAILVWHAQVINRMQHGKARTGRIRTVPGTSVQYTSSAPGESPAVQRGTLVQSYDTDMAETMGRVGSPEKYALYLERGTENMKPRPVIKEAFQDRRDDIERELRRKIE